MLSSHHGPVIATRDGLTVIDCRACGWAHLDPLPAVDDAYYRDDFWSTKGAGWLARYEAERDWLDMRHGDWLSVVEEHTARRDLLDVGAGYGFFVHYAYEQGWGVCGIDPSVECSEYASHNGYRIEIMSWEQVHPDAKYGVISALWLMEHLPDPLAFLAWCKAHLTEGGALLLAVPQEWTKLQDEACSLAAVKNYWLHPTHLHYWSQSTFYNLLGRAGFRMVDALVSYPMEQYIIDGRDYTESESIGDECHADMREFELSLSRSTRIMAQRNAALMNEGRDLVVIAKAD